jgi:hypothetical protein
MHSITNTEEVDVMASQARPRPVATKIIILATLASAVLLQLLRCRGWSIFIFSGLTATLVIPFFVAYAIAGVKARRNWYKFSLWFASLANVMGLVGIFSPPPTPYDSMAKQLHAGMTFDSVVARLGKPYLSGYNVTRHVSAIYRVDGTILPFIVRFQSVQSLVIDDPTAKVDSWCGYVRSPGGDYSVLVFAPMNMSAAEQARWISKQDGGFSIPGQPQITDADQNRPLGDGGATKLVEARSVHNPTDVEGSSPGIVQMDALRLSLVCHPVS